LQRGEPAGLLQLEGNMLLEILEDRFNPLINRREIKARVLHLGAGTPKVPDLRVSVAKALGVDFKLVYIRRVVTETGLSTSKAVIHVYKNLRDAEEFEPKHIREKNKTLAEEIEEAEAAEAKKK